MNIYSMYKLHKRIKRIEKKLETKMEPGAFHYELYDILYDLESLKAWRNKINGALIIINVILLPLIIGFFIEYIFN